MSKPNNPAELVARYLQAVRFWLPKEQQGDIIAELSEDLRSQIDERETELGRTLNQGEVEDLLRQRGRPVLVANRYLPQQYLIGPVLFPIYRFVLKVVALGYLVPSILVWACFMLFDASYRAEHARAGWASAIVSAWGGLWSIAFLAVGTVTIVFAVLERAQARSGFLENWDPRKLPAVRDSNQIPRSGSVIEVVVNQAFCIWWATSMSSNVVLDRPHVRIVLSPHWRYFFWGFLFLAIANIVLAAVNLVRPYWTGPRAAFRLACDAAGAVLFCWLLKASILAELTVTATSSARTIEITNAINLWMARSFPIAVIIGVVIAAVDAHRIFRVTTRRNRLNQDVAASVV